MAKKPSMRPSVSACTVWSDGVSMYAVPSPGLMPFADSSAWARLLLPLPSGPMSSRRPLNSDSRCLGAPR